MFALSLVYILDYFLNDSYEVESSIIILSKNEKTSMNSKENPSINFNVDLKRLNGEPTDKRLKIID